MANRRLSLLAPLGTAATCITLTLLPLLPASQRSEVSFALAARDCSTPMLKGANGAHKVGEGGH